MVEVRKLTREEFKDLLDHAHGELAAVKHLTTHQKDPYKFYQEDNNGEGLLIDGTPVYCGCVLSDSHFTYSIMREGARERYPITLYTKVKRMVLAWAKKFGDVRCEMVLDGSDESNSVLRWIRNMGYRATTDNIFVLTRRA